MFSLIWLLWVFHTAHLSKEITLAFTSMRLLVFHHDKPIPSTTKFYPTFPELGP